MKLNTRKLNENQKQLVKELLEHFNGETRVTRRQLIDAHGVLRERKCSPYFITKNAACKIKDETSKSGFARDIYNLAVFAATLKGKSPASAPVEVAQ